ncbi:MAG: NAD(P)/FAD-dependent oxidoreductase [Bacteroidia bacterium]|nr:NAD(P)/FAD-dependent oxidoreductase [Bacteroidia bacterium]
MNSKTVVVIGGGAAGFFSAINLALRKPDFRVIILEKTSKLLSKVRISGGGRCNVTHHCFENSELIKNYPRGSKELQQVFSQFSVKDTIDWFKRNGVLLKTEEDGRMFPLSDSSQTIIDCFLSLSSKLNIEIRTSEEVFSIKKQDDRFLLKTSKEFISCDSVICALGGHPKTGAYDIIKNLGHKIDQPIPSLFTLNMPGEKIKTELQGLSVQNAHVKIKDTKLSYTGPVLITHWGLSGPAVLKLSAFAAKDFFDRDYKAIIQVDWVNRTNQAEVLDLVKKHQKEKNKALPYSNAMFDLPKRLWEFFCSSAGIDNTKPWAEISNKQISNLVQVLCNSQYAMEGKTTFKDEFVTCGGINLKEINFKTMESKLVQGLYFCGEVLNIDGITGGFNFQSAWTTAWVCSQSIN